MGTHDVLDARDPERARAFTRRMLSELTALEELLESGRVEAGVQRMGAEQEMFLVDPSGRPAWVGPDLLAHLPEGRFASEIGVFNLEANLPPRHIGSGMLAQLHADLSDAVGLADRVARQHGARVALVGILPTLSLADLDLGCISPADRYLMLDHALVEMRGGPFRVSIRGRDTLDLERGDVMLESANTSFQLHLQVDPDSFAPLYNLAQLISAPQVAAAANAPLLLGRRLWQETRIALFEGAVDTRTRSEAARGMPLRVGFGTGWVQESILELFREDLARHRLALTCEPDESALDVVRAGGSPKLSALMLHNGTIWRWNRGRYGVADGVAHIRIENRVLPAGPTPSDAVANAALYYGLMFDMAEEAVSIPERLSFDDARNNLVDAARLGPDAMLTWLDGEVISARHLLLDRLIPSARQGLASLGVSGEQIDQYVGIVEARVSTGRTGARWMLEGLEHLRGHGRRDAPALLVCEMLGHLQADCPVHLWPLPNPAAVEHPQVAAELQTENLYTLRTTDLADLAAHVMRWRRIRHMPVETVDGHPVGVVTQHGLMNAAPGCSVEQVMRPNPSHVRPETPLRETLEALVAAPEGCLLVVDEGRLTGLITPRDILRALASTFGAHSAQVAEQDSQLAT